MIASDTFAIFPTTALLNLEVIATNNHQAYIETIILITSRLQHGVPYNPLRIQ